MRVYGYSTWKRHLCSGYKYRTAFGRTEKELEADLEQAIQKGRRCGISDEDIKSLFELILEG